MLNKLSDLNVEKIIYWAPFMLLWQLSLAVCQSMTDYITFESASLYDRYQRDGKLNSLCSIDPNQLFQMSNDFT